MCKETKKKINLEINIGKNLPLAPDVGRTVLSAKMKTGMVRKSKIKDFFLSAKQGKRRIGQYTNMY